MLRNVKGIFFDFDGVLFDFEPLHLQSWQEILKKKALDPSIISLEDIVGISDLDIASRIIERSQLSSDPENLIREKNTFFLKGIDGFKQDVTEIEQTLNQLQKDKLLAIVSSSSRQFILRMLEKHHLDRFFSFIVGCYETHSHKPKPDPYLYALKRSGLSGNEVVAVEDSMAGMQSAFEAGLKVIWYTKHLPTGKRGGKETVTCASFSELQELIH